MEPIVKTADVVKKDIISSSVTAVCVIGPMVGARVANGVLDTGAVLASDPEFVRLATRTHDASAQIVASTKGGFNSTKAFFGSKIEAASTDEAKAARKAKKDEMVTKLQANRFAKGLVDFGARAAEQTKEFGNSVSTYKVPVISTYACTVETSTDMLNLMVNAPSEDVAMQTAIDHCIDSDYDEVKCVKVEIVVDEMVTASE